MLRVICASTPNIRKKKYKYTLIPYICNLYSFHHISLKFIDEIFFYAILQYQENNLREKILFLLLHFFSTCWQKYLFYYKNSTFLIKYLLAYFYVVVLFETFSAAEPSSDERIRCVLFSSLLPWTRIK